MWARSYTDAPLRSKLAREAGQRYIAAHLLYSGILNLDVSGLATPECVEEPSKCPIASSDDDAALRTAVAVLAIIPREDPGKQTDAAVINPDRQLRTRISDLMRIDLQSAGTVLIKGEIYISSGWIAGHDVCGLFRLAGG